MPQVDTCKDVNILVKDLPKRTKLILDTLATLQSKKVWEITRMALEEYANKHKDEIPDLAKVLALGGVEKKK
jgi:hypothetical protein